MTEKRPVPRVGERIGRYELLEELGRGGFGVVYRARQQGLDADVALKLMLPSDAPEAKELKLYERFEQEARVIRELEHPCALKVRDYGRTPGGLPYIVTEYVRGRPLDAVLATEGSIEAGRVARIASQILGCLAEAHHRGIVHRDLKPGNIMLRDIYGERDAVKVLDFGIAKVAAARGGVRTQTGQALGTPHYIAPEQCKGERNIDGRADLYALGLMMAECVAGQRIVNAPDAMTAIYIHTSPLPHRFPPAVTSSPLFPIVERSTTKQRDARYPNAIAMRDAIEVLALPRSPASGELGGAGRGASPAPSVEHRDPDAPLAAGPNTPALPPICDPVALKASVAVGDDVMVAGNAETMPLGDVSGSSESENEGADSELLSQSVSGAERSLTPYLTWAGLVLLITAIGAVVVLMVDVGGRHSEPIELEPPTKAATTSPEAPEARQPMALPVNSSGGTGLGTGE